MPIRTSGPDARLASTPAREESRRGGSEAVSSSVRSRSFIDGPKCRHKSCRIVFSAPQVVPPAGNPLPKEIIYPNPMALLGESFCAICDYDVRARRDVQSFGADCRGDNSQTVAKCFENFDTGSTAAPDRDDNRVGLRIVCAGQRPDREGSSPSGARMRSVVSKDGDNSSSAGRRKVWRSLNGHEDESQTQPRRT